jgi:DNA-binding Lrp family transcriptional regulator
MRSWPARGATKSPERRREGVKNVKSKSKDIWLGMRDLQSNTAQNSSKRKFEGNPRNKITRVVRFAVIDEGLSLSVASGFGQRVSKSLDEIDLRILSEIQADGRITNVELAKRVGISPPPCLRRVRTLEEEGYIQGYRGLLDPQRLGFEVTVFASVHLSSQADADLRAFEDFVRTEPLVRECWMLSGEVDFILKCVAPDMATFQDFVSHLTAAPHVRNVRTSLVLHNSKYAAAVPLELKVPG